MRLCSLVNDNRMKLVADGFTMHDTRGFGGELEALM